MVYEIHWGDYWINLAPKEMIKSIKIQNIQSHEKTELSLAPGVNVILGETDAGKTAIIRALRWAIRGKPVRGNSIRSTWGGEARVSVGFEDKEVIRNKSTSDSYTISQTGTKRKGSTFKAFGTTIPEEVQRAFNIEDINFQNQLDSPFLLSENPGAVAQHFNKISGLNQIGVGLKQIKSWHLAIDRNLKFKRSERKRLKSQLSKFDYLEKFEIEIEVLEELEKQRNNLIKSKVQLSILIFDIEKVKKQRKEEIQILQMEEPVEKLLQMYKELENTKLERNRLSQAIVSLEDTVHLQRVEKAKHTTLLEKYRKVFPAVCPLCGSKVNSNNLKV